MKKYLMRCLLKPCLRYATTDLIQQIKIINVLVINSISKQFL